MGSILVTGGCGFIGSAVVRALVASGAHTVVNLDVLTYAANPHTKAALDTLPRYQFERGDVADSALVQRVLEKYRPAGVVHVAAESHVDRSIEDASSFIRTNVVGTGVLLGAATAYWRGLDHTSRGAFRFLHVSTDEVYGTLGAHGFFTEESPYAPNSPYAASKAAADHLVRAWNRTYGLPTIISNGSNTYGPYQFPEKLIPLSIVRALRGETLPIYGRGENVRDWLHVDDHAAGLVQLLQKGRVGESYNVGGGNEWRNIDVIRTLCGILDDLAPDSRGPYARNITFVADRPGHDLRYAIATDKIHASVGWRPGVAFESGLRGVVAWYLANRPWWEAVLSEQYRGQRLGLALGAQVANASR